MILSCDIVAQDAFQCVEDRIDRCFFASLFQFSPERTREVAIGQIVAKRPELKGHGLIADGNRDTRVTVDSKFPSIDSKRDFIGRSKWDRSRSDQFP